MISKKKFPASACLKKKIARCANEIEKNFLHCCKQEKKNVAKVTTTLKELKCIKLLWNFRKHRTQPMKDLFILKKSHRCTTNATFIRGESCKGK